MNSFVRLWSVTQAVLNWVSVGSLIWIPIWNTLLVIINLSSTYSIAFGSHSHSYDSPTSVASEHDSLSHSSLSSFIYILLYFWQQFYYCLVDCCVVCRAIRMSLRWCLRQDMKSSDVVAVHHQRYIIRYKPHLCLLCITNFRRIAGDHSMWKWRGNGSLSLMPPYV